MQSSLAAAVSKPAGNRARRKRCPFPSLVTQGRVEMSVRELLKVEPKMRDDGDTSQVTSLRSGQAATRAEQGVTASSACTFLQARDTTCLGRARLESLKEMEGGAQTAPKRLVPAGSQAFVEGLGSRSKALGPCEPTLPSPDSNFNPAIPNTCSREHRSISVNCADLDGCNFTTGAAKASSGR